MKCLGSRLLVPQWLPMLALALLSACGGGSSDDSDAPPLSQQEAYSATLGEVRQTRSNNSNGRNIGILTVDARNNSFTARLITSGTDGTATQIQEGQTDAAGAVIVKFIKDPGSGEWKANGTYTQEADGK